MSDPLFDLVAEMVYEFCMVAALGAMLYDALIGQPRARRRRYEQERLEYSKRRMEAIRRGEM